LGVKGMDSYEPVKMREYLRVVGKVNEKFLPWYLKWIRLYRIFLSNSPEDGRKNPVDLVLESLEGELQSWQIKQAADAMRQYHT
jgi:hypothetical protein